MNSMKNSDFKYLPASEVSTTRVNYEYQNPHLILITVTS